MNEGQKKIVTQMMDALELDQYGEKGLKEIIRQMAVEIVKRSEPPKREPLSDEEIYEIFSKNEWKKFIELARAIEKAHGIGVDDEYY